MDAWSDTMPTSGWVPTVFDAELQRRLQLEHLIEAGRVSKSTPRRIAPARRRIDWPMVFACLACGAVGVVLGRLLGIAS